MKNNLGQLSLFVNYIHVLRGEVVEEVEEGEEGKRQQPCSSHLATRRLLHARATTVPGNVRRSSAHTCYRDLVALRVHQSLSYAIATTIHMTTPLLLPLS